MVPQDVTVSLRVTLSSCVNTGSHINTGEVVFKLHQYNTIRYDRESLTWTEQLS